MKPEITHVKSLRQYHHMMGMSGLKHPLIDIFTYQSLPKYEIENTVKLIFDFYIISIKIDYDCKTQYGQTTYDFDKGVMSFIGPKQLNVVNKDFQSPQKGWSVMVHPDFLAGYPLAKKIREFRFFDYSVNEALILSEEEQLSMEELFANIQMEYKRPIDSFSQDVLISQLDLLLTICNRYYNRQFITRKKPNNELLTKFESLLHLYFNDTLLAATGQPTVRYFADQLNVSPNYLSDVLRSLSGQNAQQYIHDKLIEKAKELLSSTNLSVSEISYQLGFEFSQSFSKMFKAKTNLSPLSFRQSFN